jgi:hypothetical protein
MLSHRYALAILFKIGIVLLTFSLALDYRRAAGALWSDEATYYTMAHSLAYDQDLQYALRDMERVIREFPGGPSGE